MGGKIKEVIEANPEVVTTMDDDGWTILHREALAGNLTPVTVLLKHGADPTAKNSKGETPLDLAKILWWPKIIAALT